MPLSGDGSTLKFKQHGNFSLSSGVKKAKKKKQHDARSPGQLNKVITYIGYIHIHVSIMTYIVCRDLLTLQN